MGVKDIVEELSDTELIDRALAKGKSKNPAELRRITGVSESSWRRWRGGDRRDLNPTTRERLEQFAMGERPLRISYGESQPGRKGLGYVDGLAEAASAVEILAMGLRQKIAALTGPPAPAASSEPSARTPQQLQAMDDSDHIRAADEAENEAKRRRRKPRGKRGSES